ncbi:hypothetical protein TPAR_08650 [Tolypocladium paradoxum]|uniref:Uncharacterized protein n=1 Tax=Tolypocladium paradoxum TaxID=94208 RepID=A0A2S4KLR3_9HYPO|nr:hypothetical protein TPAR_08650 [Tolypocladium paradoxum]
MQRAPVRPPRAHVLSEEASIDAIDPTRALAGHRRPSAGASEGVEKRSRSGSAKRRLPRIIEATGAAPESVSAAPASRGGPTLATSPPPPVVQPTPPKRGWANRSCDSRPEIQKVGHANLPPRLASPLSPSHRRKDSRRSTAEAAVQRTDANIPPIKSPFRPDLGAKSTLTLSTYLVHSRPTRAHPPANKRSFHRRPRVDSRHLPSPRATGPVAFLRLRRDKALPTHRARAVPRPRVATRVVVNAQEAPRRLPRRTSFCAVGAVGPGRRSDDEDWVARLQTPFSIPRGSRQEPFTWPPGAA